MARVFTITKGLENMGALKTGGQGSVYKGKRMGEIITAVKILPTPIYSESADDKHFIAFQNEVDKLKKVNQFPNPNVVKIINSGLTDSGNFPFIEMEFIEGPDLEELLKPPNDPIFTLNEVLKVADQLSNALAHCHKLDVKHGDIKSNNVKFNTQTSNYLLLDFGLAIMSDEQRRSSLRQAGAIEFMAPEQNTGQMLFETDVYSFGVVIFELLAGVVPFPLNGKGESARNEVRLAHMVTPVPEVLQLRQQALPSHWNDKKKEYEMQVPDWLISMVYKCLEKKPTGRFASGSELHEYLSGNYTNASKSKQGTYKLAQLEQENKDLSNKNEQFQKQEFLYQKELTSKQEEIQQLKAAVSERDRQSVQGKEVPAKGINGSSGRKVVSRNWFVALMVLVIGLSCCVGFLVYHDKGFFADSSTGSIEKRTSNEQRSRSENPNRQPEDDSKKQTAPVDQQQKLPEKTSKNKSLPSSGNGQGGEQKDIRKKGSIPDTGTIDGNTEIEKTGDETITERKEDPVQPSVSSQPIEEPKENDTRRSNRVLKKYLVTSKAWFHNGPNGESKQNLYIGPEEKAVVEAIEERYGFIYVVVKNPQGRAFKGWLRKSDLNLYSIE